MQDNRQNNDNKKNKPRVKFVRLQLSMYDIYFKNKYMNLIFTTCLNVLIAMVISGYFDFIKYSNIVYFILAFVLYSILEYIVKIHIMRRFIKYIIITFGSIFIVTNFIALVVIDIIMEDLFIFESLYKMLFFSIMFSLLKRLIYRIYKTFMKGSGSYGSL